MLRDQNLPRQAGFKITTINGKRCTAVPRANVQSSTGASTTPAKTTAATAPAQSSGSDAGSSDPAAVVKDPSTGATAIPTATPSEASSTQALLRTPVSPTTAPTPEAISDNTSEIPTGRPTSSDTFVTSDGRNILTPGSSTLKGTVPSSTHTGASEATDSATLITASGGRQEIAPIVGGILGAITLIAIIGVILFICRKRRKNAESIVSPLSTGTREKFYQIDNGSLGPTKLSSRWKQELEYRYEGIQARVTNLGTSLRSKVSGERSESPTVNLDRGTSQFLHFPIQQHSRSNSSAISANTGKSTVREKFEEWWDRFREAWNREGRNPDMAGPYSYSEKSHLSQNPTFSQLISVNEEEPKFMDHSRQTSLAEPQTPDLIQFDDREDPFADPFSDPLRDPFADPTMGPQYQSWRAFKDSDDSTSNPFADPITTPAPSVPKPQSYVTAVRRSRGSSSGTLPFGRRSSNTSLSLYRPTSGTTRYPSSIAPSHDSDRDTMHSFLSSGRKGKGRSDPFDLERPDLWRMPKDRSGPPLSHYTQNHSTKRDNPPSSDQAPNLFNPVDGYGGVGHARNSSGIYPNPQRLPADQQSTTYTTRYSSGVDSLGDWGDPGPDLGDHSVGSSMRGNASSRGMSGEYDADAQAIKDVTMRGGNGFYLNENIKGSLTEFKIILDDHTRAKKELEQRREVDNVSPVSALSRDDSGKAM